MDEILKSLKIRGTCKSVKEHRHFKIYDVELENGQSIKRIENNVREIGLHLKSRTVPIVTTILEEGIVRIQTTTEEPQTLPFNELYERSIDKRPDGVLPFLLGEQSDGEPVWLDLSTVPNLLVSGSTGSGKSIFIHSLIHNAQKRDDVILYVVDPKEGCEFSQYSKSATVVYDYNSTIRLLERLNSEMDERYRLFRKIGLKNINDSQYVVPKIFVIIDEVSDIILRDRDKKNTNRGAFENLLIRLSQKSRAVGIYLCLSTQRAEVSIITGLIKANIPGKVVFKTSSSVDSRVIEMPGAENLFGYGDGLLRAGRYNNVRFQAAFCS